MTPKKRMTKTTMSLARAVKPSGRLNIDDMDNARANRSKMSLSEIKKRKTLGKKVKNAIERIDKIKDPEKLGKAAKMASKVASGMGVAGMAKKLLNEAKMRKPSGRINMDDLFNADKYKMKKPKRAPMEKGPNKMNKQKTPMKKALGPLRPIRERSLSKLISRRRGMNKR